jgi:predicted ATP-binding protein involved in virulence
VPIITIKAVTSLVPDVCDLSIDRNSGKVELKVSNFGNVVNINQLSQGQKVMVGLAADLAGRLVMLNPDEANPLDGQGIVIIDEIELHLHPRWQQTILFDLRRIFPNIQFIVATHSPQVLSTVDEKSVRKLEIDGDNNTIISQPKFQTKGVASADIMEQLMGTNKIPAVEEALWVDQFSALLIEQDNADIQPLFDKIKAHFGTEHPVVADCENQIEMAQMKERMKARIRSRNSGATK